MLLIQFTHVIADLHMAEQGEHKRSAGIVTEQGWKGKWPEKFSTAHMAIEDQGKSFYRTDDEM